MKICPRCQKTYADDNLNFCLDDGSMLTGGDAMSEATLVMHSPQATTPQPEVVTQPAWGQPQPAFPMQAPVKKSRTWLWLLLIFGGIILLCGGGFVGFMFYVGSQVGNVASNLANLENENRPPPNANRRPANTSNSSNTSISTRTNVEKLNLANWVSNEPFGTMELADGELVMASKQKRFYYVFCGRADDKTVNTDTRVTLRNMDGGSTLLGYGLVFHSNPKPLQQGYAFLVDSNTRKYRVVRHSPQKEDAVIAWTRSDAINGGSDENTLEIRDKPDKIELFINGKLVNSIKNTHGYVDGVVGLYVSDALRIAFKDLEIRK